MCKAKNLRSGESDRACNTTQRVGFWAWDAEITSQVPKLLILYSSSIFFNIVCNNIINKRDLTDIEKLSNTQSTKSWSIYKKNVSFNIILSWYYWWLRSSEIYNNIFVLKNLLHFINKETFFIKYWIHTTYRKGFLIY
jgi:hypothetical protein